jgi:hypothetical protein
MKDDNVYAAVWFDGKIDERSLTISEEDGLAFSYLEENPAKFLGMLKFLDPEEQDMLLCYFLLHRTQADLGLIFGITQTRVSAAVRLALKTMLSIAIVGIPDEDTLREMLVRHGLEDTVADDGLTEMILAYDELRDWTEVKVEYDFTGSLGVLVRHAGKTLLASSKMTDQACGAWLIFIAGSTVEPHAGGRHRKAMSGDIRRVDPDCVGSFTVSLDDPQWEEAFQTTGRPM